MAMICDMCGKKPRKGKNRSFSNRKTVRRFEPNLQPFRMKTQTTTISAKICTRCRRTLAKDAKGI